MTQTQQDLLIRDYGRALNLIYPMGLLEMLEETLEIYRKNFGVLFAIALIPAVFNTLFSVALTVLERFPEKQKLLPLAYASSPLIFFTVFLGFGAQVFVSLKALKGENIGFFSAWREILGRIFAYSVTHFLSFLALMSGLVFCCLGVIFTAILFSVILSQIILEENIGYFRAITRHLQLVYPNWQWARVLGFFIVAYVLVIIFEILISGGSVILLFTAEFVGHYLPISGRLAMVGLGNLWSNLASAITTPYLAVFLTILYFDLRARQESNDIEILLERWGA